MRKSEIFHIFLCPISPTNQALDSSLATSPPVYTISRTILNKSVAFIQPNDEWMLCWGSFRAPRAPYHDSVRVGSWNGSVVFFSVKCRFSAAGTFCARLHQTCVCVRSHTYKKNFFFCLCVSFYSIGVYFVSVCVSVFLWVVWSLHILLSVGAYLPVRLRLSVAAPSAVSQCQCLCISASVCLHSFINKLCPLFFSYLLLLFFSPCLFYKQPRLFCVLSRKNLQFST